MSKIILFISIILTFTTPTFADEFPRMKGCSDWRVPGAIQGCLNLIERDDKYRAHAHSVIGYEHYITRQNSKAIIEFNKVIKFHDKTNSTFDYADSAKYFLGMIYYQGSNDVEKDYKKALSYFSDTNYYKARSMSDKLKFYFRQEADSKRYAEEKERKRIEKQQLIAKRAEEKERKRIEKQQLIAKQVKDKAKKIKSATKRCSLNNNSKKQFLGCLTLAKRNNIDAQKKVADMYLSGKGVTKNHTKSLYWYKKLAKRGDNNAKLQVIKLSKKVKKKQKEDRVKRQLKAAKDMKNLKKGINYTYSKNGSCTKSSKKYCLNVEQYKELCKKISGVTKRGAETPFVYDSKGKHLADAGSLDSYKASWTEEKNQCFFIINVSGTFRGTSERVTGWGYVSEFILNSSNSVLVHAAYPP